MDNSYDMIQFHIPAMGYCCDIACQVATQDACIP